MKPINPAFDDRDHELAHGYICGSDARRSEMKPVASFDADLVALRTVLGDVRKEERAEMGIEDRIAQARKEEAERCAKIADSYVGSLGIPGDQVASEIADLIRGEGRLMRP